MGIVDLHVPGEWPAIAPLPPEDIASGKADQRGVELFAAPQDGLTVGLWSCTPWVATSGPYPFDEFMILLEGSVIIRLPDGRAETLRAGDAFFIPKGLDCTWDQPEPVKKIYVIFENGTADPAAGLPLRVNTATTLAPSPGPSAAVLIGPEPHQQAAKLYEDASGQFSVGVWATTPYTRRPIPYPRHELMHLLDGEVTLTADGAAPRTYTKGDTFLVPKSCVVDWVSTVDVAKIYCSIVPEAAT